MAKQSFAPVFPHWELFIKNTFMPILDMFKSNEHTTDVTKRFYKEDGIWYIDLPEFLEQGLGTRANLMMVGGADTLLDKLSNNGTEATIRFSNSGFRPTKEEVILIRTDLGYDETYLKNVGHAPVDGGAYYSVKSIDQNLCNHKLWLCPVTKYVFNGYYPPVIHVETI
jgi:hypothetical protein